MQTHTQIPASAAPVLTQGPSFVVGQNRRGQWLAVEIDGSGGGIFADREAAMRFAASETNRRPEAVRLAGAPIELRF